MQNRSFSRETKQVEELKYLDSKHITGLNNISSIMHFPFNPSIASKLYLYHQRLLSHHLDSNPQQKPIPNNKTKGSKN